MNDNKSFNSLVDVLQARASSQHCINFIDGQDSSQSVGFGEMFQRALRRFVGVSGCRRKSWRLSYSSKW